MRVLEGRAEKGTLFEAGQLLVLWFCGRRGSRWLFFCHFE